MGVSWGHLAPALLRLIELGATGTYHVTNSGRTSWYDCAVFALLDNTAWSALGEPPLPPWTDRLRAYLGELRRRGRLPAPPGALLSSPT